MSIEQRVYVGAYLECKNELVPHYKSVKKCICHKHHYPVELNYCPICSCSLVTEKIPHGESSKIDFNEVLFDNDLVDIILNTNQIFKSRGIDIWISNISVGRMKGIKYGSDNQIYEIPLNVPFNQEIEAFYKHEDIRKVIDLAEETYGEENVNVKFGCIVYYI